MGGAYNPLCTAVTVTLFPYAPSSQEKVGFVPENTKTHAHTHSERWQPDCGCRAYIWWNCGPADTCRWGEDESGRTTPPNDLSGNGGEEANILHVYVINLGIGWVCVSVCVSRRSYCNLSSGSGVKPSISTHHIHTKGTMGFSSPSPDDESR